MLLHKLFFFLSEKLFAKHTWNNTRYNENNATRYIKGMCVFCVLTFDFDKMTKNVCKKMLMESSQKMPA